MVGPRLWERQNILAGIAAQYTGLSFFSPFSDACRRRCLSRGLTRRPGLSDYLSNTILRKPKTASWRARLLRPVCHQKQFFWLRGRPSLEEMGIFLEFSTRTTSGGCATRARRSAPGTKPVLVSKTKPVLFFPKQNKK